MSIEVGSMKTVRSFKELDVSSDIYRVQEQIEDLSGLIVRIQEGNADPRAICHSIENIRTAVELYRERVAVYKEGFKVIQAPNSSDQVVIRNCILGNAGDKMMGAHEDNISRLAEGPDEIEKAIDDLALRGNYNTVKAIASTVALIGVMGLLA